MTGGYKKSLSGEQKFPMIRNLNPKGKTLGPKIGPFKDLRAFPFTGLRKIRTIPFFPPRNIPERSKVPEAAPVDSVSLGGNPLLDLPFPSPGDRIKSDDIKKLSRSLTVIYDAYRLS